MASFNINDTVGVLIRVLQNHREIIRLWHEVSGLLVKIGLMPSQATPGHATHKYDLKWVQESLNKLDNAGLKVDGRLGPATVAAITKYQQKHPDLEPDGWMGMLTLAALETDMGQPGRGTSGP